MGEGYEKYAMISHARLLELFDYDPTIGQFKRKKSRGNCVSGSLAGTIKENGYVKLTIDGKMYYGHILAWFYIQGEWPIRIKQLNGIREDIRLCNLIEITDRVQGSCYRDTASGHRGVSKNGKGWTITLRGKYIGYSQDKLEAIRIRNAALRK